MIGPSPPAAEAAAPAAVVVAPAVVAGDEVVGDVVGAAEPPLELSPPHAAATRPADTRSAVGTTHRCLVMVHPLRIAMRNELPKASPRMGATWASPDADVSLRNLTARRGVL